MTNEQKSIEGKEQANANANSNAGNIPQGLDKIERAEFAVKRLEETEKRIDDKIAKLTELEANRILGSTAGNHIEPKTPEQMQQQKAQGLADDIVKAFH